jgi:hypothetical protein
LPGHNNLFKEYEQGRRALMLLSAERATFRQPETEKSISEIP